MYTYILYLKYIYILQIQATIFFSHSHGPSIWTGSHLLPPRGELIPERHPAPRSIATNFPVMKHGSGSKPWYPITRSHSWLMDGYSPIHMVIS